MPSRPAADSLAIAHALADAAYAAWQDVAGQADRHEKVGMGAGGNLTSRADDILEKAILREAKRFGISVLSEEAGMVDEGGRWLAVVDPLDGSRNAGRGIPFHCTSVAVGPADGSLKDLQAGVVRNLVTGDTYAAAKGGAPTVNGKPFGARGFDGEEVLVGVIADYSESEIEEAHANPDHHIRDLGSAALEMCLVGTGALDAFVVRRPWLRVIDIAAATLFVREAGGLVLDPASQRDLDAPLNLEVRCGVLAAHSVEARRAVSGTRIAPSRAPSGKMAGPIGEGALTWALVGKAGIPHVKREALWLRDYLVSKGQKVLLEADLARADGAAAHTL